jgi:hypothetical protein
MMSTIQIDIKISVYGHKTVFQSQAQTLDPFI